VENYCCNAEVYDLVEYILYACTKQLILTYNPNTKTARQTAVKSPNDGGF